MEKYLIDIEENTRPRSQILVEVEYNKNEHRLDLLDSIDLSDGNYVMGVTSFDTVNSIFNITSKNNKIIYFVGLNWKEIVFSYGAYEIDKINDEIIRQLSLELAVTDPEESPTILEANTSTLHSIIHLANGYKIDFNKPKTLSDLFGFESKILRDSYNYSENKVNIIDIHRLQLCCDCIVGSLRNGYPSNTLFTVVLNEAPSVKIVREPNLVLYKHIYKEKLVAIQFWMEDGDGNRIENHAEVVAFTLHIKKNS